MNRRLLVLLLCFAMAFALRSTRGVPTPPAPGGSASAGFPLPVGIEKTNSGYRAVKDGMELAYVPGGKFTMGSETGNFDERPAHDVYLGPYLIDKHEVTNRQFRKFLEESGYDTTSPWKRGFAPGQEDFPVRFVNWHDARAYAKWAGRDLPTEAQWEKAARGEKGLAYPWGNVWREGAARTGAAIEAGPVKVGSFPEGESPYGCADLAGNVWEWVRDWYDRRYYKGFNGGGVTRNPAGPADGAKPEQRFIDSNTAAGNERSTRKVIRGGGWVAGGVENSRSSKRSWGNPRYWFSDTGFRCALSLGR